MCKTIRVIIWQLTRFILIGYSWLLSAEYFSVYGLLVNISAVSVFYALKTTTRSKRVLWLALFVIMQLVDANSILIEQLVRKRLGILKKNILRPSIQTFHLLRFIFFVYFSSDESRWATTSERVHIGVLLYALAHDRLLFRRPRRYTSKSRSHKRESPVSTLYVR